LKAFFIRIISHFLHISFINFKCKTKFNWIKWKLLRGTNRETSLMLINKQNFAFKVQKIIFLIYNATSER